MSPTKQQSVRLSDRMNVPLFGAGLFLLCVAVVLNLDIGVYIISTYFPDRPQLPDLLFMTMPYIQWTQYLTDIANVVSIGLLIWYVAAYNRLFELPFITMTIAVGEILRGFLILLNPFAGPLGNGAHYGLTTITQLGQFPSGHTFVVVAAYLLVDRRIAPKLKLWLLISMIVEIVSLVLSRGHYAIDIVGGIFMAYLVVGEMRRYYSSFLPTPAPRSHA